MNTTEVLRLVENVNYIDAKLPAEGRDKGESWIGFRSTEPNDPSKNNHREQ